MIRIVKRPGRLALAGLLCVVAALVAAPAHAATHSGNGRALIVRPLTLVKDTDLQFGSIIPGPLAGTVTINSGNGARSATGPLTLVGNGFSRATFVTVTDGWGFMTVTIGGTTAITLNRSGGGASMTGNLILANLPGLQLGTNNATTKTSFVGDNALVTIGIGGTLNVGANQPTGTYTATFNVTTNYF